MERQRGSYRRVAEPQGLRRLLRSPDQGTRVHSKRLLAPAAMPSKTRNEDLEAAIADPDHTPKPKPCCPPHRLTAAILVQALAILGLLAALRVRARCDTKVPAPDRCVLGSFARRTLISFIREACTGLPPERDEQNK